MSAVGNPILHILVVGFHHHKGSIVEYSHPCLFPAEEKGEHSLSSSVASSSWKHLPHLALPDGCHNYENESVYFTLPDLSVGSGCVYGVACCRQMESRHLVNLDREVTRSTIQKSVCIISQYPVFGLIEAKLDLVTHAYFNSKDFSDVKILKEAFDNLNKLFLNPVQHTAILHIGLSQRDLIMRYHHRLLQIFKALLLKQRVLIHGSRAKNVSCTILSIMSLFPYSLEGLDGSESSGMCECALPLTVFSDTFSFQPYLCLQQMDSLLNPSCKSVLVGVGNPLFNKQHHKLCDVFVNMSDGHITINQPLLRPVLHLSDADLRFCWTLSDTVSDHSTTGVTSSVDTSTLGLHSDWLGSNEWVLSRFKLYLLSLLKTSLSGDESAIHQFNYDFMLAWKQGPVYSTWQEGYKARGEVRTTEPRLRAHSTSVDSETSLFESIQPTHICSGELSVSDLKRRLMTQASDYGLSVQSQEQVYLQTQQALAQAGERVSNAVNRVWSTASSTVYSWWGGGSQEKNQ